MTTRRHEARVLYKIPPELARLVGARTSAEPSRSK